jgi:hypothetical protein
VDSSANRRPQEVPEIYGHGQCLQLLPLAMVDACRMEQSPFLVTIDDQRVGAWSSVRLPFEPKGWVRDYRRQLQRALRSLAPSPTSVLYAEYGAPDGGFADLEMASSTTWGAAATRTSLATDSSGPTPVTQAVPAQSLRRKRSL